MEYIISKKKRKKTFEKHLALADYKEYLNLVDRLLLCQILKKIYLLIY